MKTGLLFSFIVIVLDQASKIFMLDWIFNPPRQVEVLSFFNLTPVWNRGVSFGLLQADSLLARYILIIMAGLIVAGLLVWLYRSGSLILQIALGLIIGGALGNLIDRVRFGAVVDFLDFHANMYHWPAFNLADSAITIGVGLIIFDHFTNGKESVKKKS